MKEMFRFQFAVLLLVVLNACSTMNPDSIPGYSTDPVYGYSPDHPLSLHAGSAREASEKVEAYFSGLQTPDGERLRVTGKTRVENPNYKKPRIVLYNWITGEQINPGNGSFLVKYELSTDTGEAFREVYVNHFTREEPRVPHALISAPDTASEASLASENMPNIQ